MLNGAVPQIVLNQAGVRALVSEVKAAGMPQRVRMHRRRQLGLLVVFP